MTNYAFKEWLTFEEAAAWLSDAAGTSFTEEDISRAARQSRLPVHYWPTDDAQLGLFHLQLSPGSGEVIESSAHLDLAGCKLLSLIDGPIPIPNYQLFQTAVKHCETGRWIGISAFPDEPEPYGCYEVADDDQPRSLGRGSHQILVHLSDLERLCDSLPMPNINPPHGLALGIAEFPSTNQVLCLARSTLHWSNYPDLEFSSQHTSEGQSTTVPLLRALGFATHLIAQLGQELDALESLPSKRKRLTRGNSPNVSAISKALSEVAKGLRHEGHGIQGDGFQKLLRSALREVE
ncbi:hypothetical protein [Pseudomonas aeruginosa]|uniref:hypothetical protein n=1 Tax=Pseudomonas aeruginosa TaxID=287 RepID=UPI000F535FB4|nr:hypothetical protein [Pseudomonas aeruginosa]RTW10501.1 hypothetical protein DZA01_29525 [Pseudomonas aeruginosa]HDQ4463259.1 hypothetical protein [Pseudomonas aeruginosa]HDQ4720865.1 hypothetical protein [Pseudomonas aeruginosa]